MATILFVAYPILGLLLGALSAVLVSRIRRPMEEFHYRLSATLTLVLFCIANLLGSRWTGSEKISLIAAVAMALMMGAGVFSDAWKGRAGFLSNPWIVSLLLLAAPWISLDLLSSSSHSLKMAVSLLGIAAVAVAGAVLYRIFPSGGRWGRSLAVVVVLLLFFLGAEWLLCRRSPAVAGMSVAGPHGKPNVLLITMDTVRADHLSLYGYSRDTSPNLRNLAREATVYRRAIAAADMTLPSHASIFTGLYPSWHQATYALPDWPHGRPLANRFTTLAEIL